MFKILVHLYNVCYEKCILAACLQFYQSALPVLFMVSNFYNTNLRVPILHC